MPKLFIDTERLRDLNSGLGQVCLNLGHELVQQCASQSASWELTFLVPPGQSGIFGGARSGVPVGYVEASWLRKFYIPGRYDVWHCLHQDSTYLPRAGQGKLLLTIHDLNFLNRSDYSDAKKARKRQDLQRRVDQATALTTISNATSDDVRANLRVDTKPLTVIYNGVATDPFQAPTEPDAEELKPLAQQPYFLFVGVIHPKKNVHTLLPLLEAFPDYRLVLAGPDDHPYARHIYEQAENLGVLNRLVMPGAVSENDKLWLYAHCEAFLFPSLSEGFGLPAVEAMRFGKPVFLSTLTSLPEIGGKEAYYFQDFEPESMAKVLHDGLHDFGQNTLRQERQLRRASEFTWTKAAEAFWILYQKLVGN
ncbi:MAG: glycosyltransferase family 4 protein [Spirosoma sp.]|nr:glycosyltransferase family 4 protein [Spirosoma sp.]